MNKLLDLRFVIGAFFVLIGLLLGGYGLFSSSLSDNTKEINTWCGLVFLLFGIFMIFLSFRKDADDELLQGPTSHIPKG